MAQVHCPYNDKSCPKIRDLVAEQSAIKSTLNTIMKLTYIMAGIMTANLGITIFL